jgi:dihydropteroate synthase
VPCGGDAFAAAAGFFHRTSSGAVESGMGDHNPRQINPQVSQLATLAPATSEQGGAKLTTRHGSVDFSRRTVVMAILNITPDSFYDGGRHGEVSQAIRDGLSMAEGGAEIIDIGGESTRPGSRPVSEDEELARVLPVLHGLRREVKVPISIDTYKSKVAQRALEAGADMINDISALRFDPEMISVVAREQVPVVLMHMQGTPRTMQAEPRYDDVVREVRDFLAAQLYKALDEGIAQQAVVIDPGIGFGKTLEHNLALLRGLPALAALGQPVLVGASRKAFVGKILDLDPEERLEGSLAAAVAAILNGANILRVHDVRETVRAARVADALRYGPGAF